ncbi:MAG: NfeD family protein [Acidimicrobiales bacterium]
MLDLGINLDVWPWVWLFVAVTFALIELTILGGSFILLPFAISAFLASLLGFYDVAIEVQWAVFVFGGGIMFVGFYRWARNFLEANVLPPGVGADRLVGTTGIVMVDISPEDTGRRGRVSIDGEVWGAVGAGGTELVEGVRVRIVEVKGTKVVVEPVGSAGPQEENNQ